MSALHFDADIDINKIEQGVKKIDSELHSLALKAANSGSILDNSFKEAGSSADQFSKKTINAGNAMASIGALVSLSVLAGFAKEIANVRGEWQKYEAVLTNTLRSNQDAKDSLDMISKYGAKTNFQVNELTDSYVKLASQGFKPTRDELASLGDLAASKAKGFDQLTEAIIDAETFEFERLKEFGIRASKNGDQITFTFKGIKTTVDASAESVRNYILSLGQLDGVKGSTEAISKTIVGLTSNLEDAVNQMMNGIGQSQEGLIAGSISAATDLVNNYEKVSDIIKVLVVTYGAYKAASIALAVIETYRSEMMVTKTVAGMYQAVKVTQTLTFAQWASAKAQGALNAATKANIYVAAASAIIGLVTWLALFSDSADEAAEAQAKVNETVNAERANIEALVTQIKGENTANADRAKALKELNDILPDSVGLIDAQTLSTKKGKDAIDEYIKSIRKKAEIESLTAELNKNLSEQSKVSSGDMSGQLNFAQRISYYGLTPDEKEADRSRAMYNLKEQEVQIKKNIEAVVSGNKAESDAAKNTITVGNQIIENKKRIIESENKLKELRSKDSNATPEDIKKQSDLVDRLKEQQAVLTGFKEKEKKAVDELKLAQENMEKAAKSGDQTLIDIASKKLIRLQEEKNLTDALIESQLAVIRNSTLTSIGANTVSQAIDNIKKSTGLNFDTKTPKKITADFEGEKLHAKSKKITEDQEKADKKRLDTQKQLIDGAYQLTNMLIDQIGLTEDQADQLRQTVDIFANLASGNYIQAGLQALTQTISGTDYSSIFLKVFEKQLEKINELLEDNQRLIDKSSREGGQNEAYAERVELLKKQLEINKQQVAAAEHALRVAKSDEKSLFGVLFGSTKDERNALERVQNDLKKTQQEIEDTQQAWNDFLRGGMTENTIADSIAKGFQDSKTSVVDFANFVNDMLFDAALSVFKAEILGPEITAMSEYVKTSLLDNVLTSDEVAKVNELSKSIIDKSRPLWENLTSALNLDSATSTTSSKSISGISASYSEDTLSAMVGQTMAQRVDIKTISIDIKANQEIFRNMLEYMDLSLSVLNNIEKNTKGISRLENVENSLNEINATLKKGLMV